MLGPLVALRLGAAFVPVRKQGKLPGECAQATYVKEYGEVNYLGIHGEDEKNLIERVGYF